MDGLSGAASVIAVIDISAKIISLCFQYSIAVKDAKHDIQRLQIKVKDLARILESVKNTLESRGKTRLSATHSLFKSLNLCLEDLKKLHAKLEPGKTRRFIGRIGVQALQWPFTSKQVEKRVSSLEEYEQTFILALQADQTNLLLDFDQKIDLVTDNANSVNEKFDLARLPTAKGASFDSHAEEHSARCLPNTRTDLLQSILQWAKTRDGKPIFWLSGMAGTGKSTIARTIAQSLDAHGQLGASFFFKKGEGERGNASRFFTTIATDLIACEPGMLSGIRSALKDDPAISEKALKDQFEKLILLPLSSIQQARFKASARIIVIDALDECEREEDIRAILQLLARTKDVQPVSLRVIVTSRPELHIRLGFKQMPDKTYEDLILSEVAKNTIEHDIRVFLEHELGLIRQERLLSPEWPTKDQIQTLVDLAVPLFIFAATVCRYVGTKGGDPEEYLSKIIQYRKSTFSQLDRTYLPVLDQLLNEQDDEDRERWLESFRRLVGSIVLLQTPLSAVSLARILKIPQKQVKYRLDALHSVLSVPDDENAPIRLLHLSFREFLVDPKKQGISPFWVNEKERHKELVSLCLDLMSSPEFGLRQNICGLMPGEQKYSINAEIVAKTVAPELRYACLYWVYHLSRSGYSFVDGDSTHLFLQEHYLHWLEVMSLIGETSNCIHLLEELQTFANPSQLSSLAFLRDANRFALRFRLILEDAPLQVYSSALLFAPHASVIRQTFLSKIPQGISMVSEGEEDWDACRSTLEGHSDTAHAIAFSSDGHLLASGSSDTTIRLWEASTGTSRSTLEGHSDWVRDVSFSPDGQLLASASSDRTVRVWEVATGICRSILKGHREKVISVAFSPDGQMIASSSGDFTVRMWEVESGSSLSVLEGHSDQVLDVTFSPDGHLIASASRDFTVRLWNASGTYLSALEGHYYWVFDVAFSPNGHLIASGSADATIRLWNVETGSCTSILKGHIDQVNVVNFSPNGNLLASASGDLSVRIWDVAKGECIRTLEGHSDWVQDVNFSPDGQLIASAASDKTIRVWETSIEADRSKFEGHLDWVKDVKFSPNGRILVSASGDKTLRVWESATGTCRCTLQGHSDQINAVTFSIDGNIVASASDDETIRLWDMEEAKCVQILEGHTDWVKNVSISPKDSQLVASCSWDATVRLWDAVTGACLHMLNHPGPAYSVTFSPDGKIVASASKEGTVRLWQVVTGTLLNTLEGHSSWVKNIVFSPDGQLLASAAADQKVLLWEVLKGTCRSIHDGGTDWVNDVTFSTDGQYLYTGGGVVSVHTSDENSTTRKEIVPNIFVQVSWVLRNHQPWLWLPPEYRSNCVAVYEDKVCFGYTSGRVMFLNIDLT